MHWISTEYAPLVPQRSFMLVYR